MAEQMEIQKPSIGRIVHVFWPSVYGEKPMAAIVADVLDEDTLSINATACNHDGTNGPVQCVPHASQPRHLSAWYWDWPAKI